jgi:hypothetical protein
VSPLRTAASQQITPLSTMSSMKGPEIHEKQRHPLRIVAWILTVLIIGGLFGASMYYVYVTGKYMTIEAYALKYMPFLSRLFAK